MKRRNLLQLAAMGTTAAVLPRPVHSVPSKAALDFANPADILPADILKVLIKLRGRLDGKPVFWWLKGTRYGVVGTEIKPMFTANVGSVHRFVAQPDGTYRLTMIEHSYYTDPESGALLNAWQNPFTGQTSQIQHFLMGPINATMTVNGMTPPTAVGGSSEETKATLGPITVAGDDLWVREDSSATLHPADPKLPTYRGNDLATYHGSLREVTDPKIVSAHATLHYQSVTAWRSWMKMGDISGHLMAREVGSKVARPADLPETFQALARQVHPQQWAAILKDPTAALEAAPAPSTYSR